MARPILLRTLSGQGVNAVLITLTYIFLFFNTVSFVKSTKKIFKRGLRKRDPF